MRNCNPFAADKHAYGEDYICCNLDCHTHVYGGPDFHTPNCNADAYAFLLPAVLCEPVSHQIPAHYFDTDPYFSAVFRLDRNAGPVRDTGVHLCNDNTGAASSSSGRHPVEDAEP
jgi:hypothetical protein